jgi:Carboxypeptidase regulatory-like domain/FG-GAP-like repeat
MKQISKFSTRNILFYLTIAVFSFGSVNAQDLLKSKPQGDNSVKLNGTFDIPSESNGKFANENPLSAVVADIDSDGINDLIIGRNGSISIQRGDINAFAPKTETAWEAIRDLRYISPFESKTHSFGLPISADFVQTGDFTRDGNIDVIAASRNANELVLLTGDGKGNFSESREIFVGGNVSVMTVGDVNRLDGLADVIVGVGNEVLVYQGFGDILSREPSRISLANTVETMAVGQLDANTFTDIAVGNGNQISIISGSDDKNEVNDLPQSFGVRSLVVGDFLPDREFRAEIATLDEAGAIHILSRGDLDTRPVTKHEQLASQVRDYKAKGNLVPQRILNQLSKEDLLEPVKLAESDNQTWNEYDQFFGAVPTGLASSNAILTSGRLSNSGEDLIVLDSDNNEINVMPMAIAESESGEKVSYAGKRQSVKFSLEGSPIVAITGRFNFDSEKDLLVLQSGKSEASTLLTAPQASFTVNNAGDAVDAVPGNGVCATAGAVCTLRAAIMESNKLAGSDSITINSGLNITLSTGSPDNDFNSPFNTEAGGDLDITCVVANPAFDACTTPVSTNINNLTITGAAGGNTIAAGTFTASAPITNTTDRVFDIGFDGIFGGGFGGQTGIQVTMSNLTIQNGNVRENCDVVNCGAGNNWGNFARGGAIRIDGNASATTGALNLTSVTINNNQADHNSGGVFNQFAAISYSSVTNTTNIGKAGQGGALSFGATAAASTLSITNSSFTGNEARSGSVFGTATTDVDGGAIALGMATNTGTISNTNFTNNISQDDGGALRAFGGAVTVTGGTMSGNTARDDGGAVWGDIDTVGAGRFLTLSGTTITGNNANSDTSGGGDGGGIFRDRGTLNVTNCSIGTVGSPNRANNGGGIAHAFRAGASATNVTTINVDNGFITGNNATRTTGLGEGGAVFINGANFNAGNPSTLNVGSTTSVTIDENNANVHGGGISLTGGSTGTLTRAAFSANDADTDNNASGDGGGLYHNNTGGTTTIASTVSFSNNGNGATTTENGGAIHHSSGTLTLNSPTVSGNDADVQGGGLFVSGGIVNVNGVTFSANTFPANAAEVRLTGGTTNFSGTVTIPGELSIAGGTLVAGSSLTNLGEDFQFSSGNFTPGTSTVNFNGTVAQQIYGGSVPTFNNLTDANTTAQLSVINGVVVSGTLDINANARLNPSAAAIVSGAGTLTGGGTAQVTRTAATADFSSQYTITNKTLTNLLVDYVGAAAQVISPITFGRLGLNNAAGATMSGNTTVNSTLLLTNGTLAVGANTLTLNSNVTQTAGTFSSAATGTVNYNQGSNGQITAAANYGNLTFSNFNKILPSGVVGVQTVFTPGTATGHTITGNTFDFNGSAAQTVPAFTFNNLSTSNGGTKTASGTVTANGNVTIGTSTTLALSGNTLNIGGNFTNSGTFSGSFANPDAPQVGGKVVLNGTAAQTVGGTVTTTFNDLQVNNATGITFSQNGTVNGILTLTSGNVSMGANTLTMGGSSSVSRTSGHILGKMLKTFSGIGSFTYPVGTANGFSPVVANVTAGAGSLTIDAKQTVHPNAPSPANAIARFWTLSGSGITTDLTFNYLQPDVIGANENLFKMVRINGGVISQVFAHNPPSVVIDTAANTILIKNISTFSDWTFAQLVPTAATATINGRVLTAGGRGINRARVTITDTNGQIRYAITNPFGYYRFADLPTGSDYVLSVSSKLYEFKQSTRFISLQENLGNEDFTALP